MRFYKHVMPPTQLGCWHFARPIDVHGLAASGMLRRRRSRGNGVTADLTRGFNGRLQVSAYVADVVAMAEIFPVDVAATHINAYDFTRGV